MSDTSRTECLLVGSGAAGIAAAVWLDDYGVPFEWVSRDSGLGGIFSEVHNPIVDYPGLVVESGHEMAKQFAAYLDQSPVDSPGRAEVEQLTKRGELWQASLAGQGDVRSETIVVATGTRKKRLGIPGEREAAGSTVSFSVSRDVDSVAGEEVGIVGGGDAGFEGALELADAGCRVHMLLRNSNFKARERFIEPAEQSDRIVFHPFPTRVRAIEQTRRGCRLQLDEAGETRQLDIAKLFIRIGVEPQYPELDPMPETDDRGFIRVDRQQRTTESGLVAIGDVTDTPLRAVCTSTGNGAIAANTVARKLDYIGR